MGTIGKVPQVYRVLIIDDEESLHERMRHELNEYYDLISAYDGSTGLKKLHNERPNLVILDLEFKDSAATGFEICKRIRELSDVPIVVLTTNEDDEAQVEMLNVGADDYVTKNKLNTLKARINATLRRVNIENQDEPHVYFYEDGELSINLVRRRIERDGESLRLSPIEFRLLLSLLKSSPKPVPYYQLLEDIWGPDHSVSLSYLRVYTWHLRKKIEADHTNPQYIKNEPNVGYYFDKQFSS